MRVFDIEGKECLGMYAIQAHLGQHVIPAPGIVLKVRLHAEPNVLGWMHGYIVTKVFFLAEGTDRQLAQIEGFVPVKSVPKFEYQKQGPLK